MESNEQNQEVFSRWHDTSTLSNDKLLQKKKVDSLLSPRFKLIAPYPCCEFRKGQIISPVTNHKIEHYRGFNVNFAELKWHQDRTEEELPGYVKSKKYGIVAKLLSATIIRNMASLEDETGSIADMDIRDFVPAAEYEWIEYIQNKKK